MLNVHIFSKKNKKTKKPKKTVTCFPWEVFISSGTELSPPPLSLSLFPFPVHPWGESKRGAVSVDSRLTG